MYGLTYPPDNGIPVFIQERLHVFIQIKGVEGALTGKCHLPRPLCPRLYLAQAEIRMKSETRNPKGPK
jgi:hypothetical protein